MYVWKDDSKLERQRKTHNIFIKSLKIVSFIFLFFPFVCFAGFENAPWHPATMTTFYLLLWPILLHSRTQILITKWNTQKSKKRKEETKEKIHRIIRKIMENEEKWTSRGSFFFYFYFSSFFWLHSKTKNEKCSKLHCFNEKLNWKNN